MCLQCHAYVGLAAEIVCLFAAGAVIYAGDMPSGMRHGINEFLMHRLKVVLAHQPFANALLVGYHENMVEMP